MKRMEAVSESIGYLIIFGLVLTGIGLITLYGYPLLMQQESSANLRNMEQTMIVLQNDMKSLTYKLANYKETSLRVSGGSLQFHNNVSTLQKFRIWAEDGPFLVFDSGDFFPGELRYFSPSDNTVITLENGAVIKKQLSIAGSVMLAEPRWYVDVDPTGRRTLIINFMSVGNTTAKPNIQNLSRTGVGLVRMSHFQTLISNSTDLAGGAWVYIQYTNNNKDTIMPDGYELAWRTYLTDPNNLDFEATGVPGQYRNKAGKPITTIILKEYDIMVESL